MHRFFVPAEQTQNAEFELPASETHHATRVLRLKPRDRVEVLNGAGESILCEMEAVTPPGVRLRVLQRHQAAPPTCVITLFQAVPKPRAMELIVQKATELGTSRVVPLLSDRTVAHWDEADLRGKTTKWRAVAIEAAKQCGSPWLPDIDSPQTVAAALRNARRSELTLLASLQPGARHPRRCFDDCRLTDQPIPPSAAVWVGPEGDFTPAELNAIRSSGAQPITLGPLVLRSETAAIYCLSILAYETQWAPG